MTSQYIKKIIYICFSLWCSVVLLSCATERQIKVSSGERVTWPTAPLKPRIEYVASLSKPEDLGISQGLIGFLKEAAIGKVDTSMVLPMAVVENGRGQLLVADPGKKGIHRYDTERKKYRFVRRLRNLDFESPVGMAADKAGNVYIADSELAKVFVLRYGEDFATPLPLAEDFIRPTGIAVDKETGWIYVVDTGAHAVYVFQPDNQLIKRFGNRGSGDGEFNFPTYIWQSQNKNLLITDSLNFRIQIFDRYGGYLSQFGFVGNGTGDLARPKGVAQDSSGNIYVTDSLFHTVQIFDESGKFLLNYGEQGIGPGEFWLPVGITITEDGTIYVADSYNKRVQVFRYIGSEQ